MRSPQLNLAELRQFLHLPLGVKVSDNQDAMEARWVELYPFRGLESGHYPVGVPTS